MRWRAAVRLLVLIAIIVGLVHSAPWIAAQQPQAIGSVALSAPLDKPEAWDYATRVWGDPWDMDQRSDVYLAYTSCPTPTGAGYSNVSVSGGIWRGTVASSPGQMILLNPGYQSSLNIPQDGQARPLDANAYRWVTYRLYSSQNTVAAFYWMKGDLSEFSRYGVSEVFPISQGWNIYTMYMPALRDTTPPPGIGGEAWGGAITGLRFDVFGTGTQVRLDWMRISQGQAGNRVSWSGAGMGGQVEVAFDNGDGNGYARLRYFPSGKIEANISTGSTSGSFDVPASFAPGSYRARVTVSGASAYSSGQWAFHAVPIARFVAPSYTSGPDWATSVTGNPWDMAGTDDVDAAATEGVTYRISDGVLRITNVPDGRSTCDPNWPHRPVALNLHGQPIDTGKYRYFSFRYRIDQAPDQGGGSVTRVRWQLPKNSWPTGLTDDISVYENEWTVYHLDLATVPLESLTAGWTQFPYEILQIVANESHSAWTSHLDWAMLTAENQARDAYAASWEIVQGYPTRATLYWDGDRSPANGFARGPYQAAASAAQPAATHRVYLPLVMRSNGAGQHAFVLSMDGLAFGATYYVALKLEDGFNTVYWYSDLPVRRIP